MAVEFFQIFEIELLIAPVLLRHGANCDHCRLITAVGQPVQKISPSLTLTEGAETAELRKLNEEILDEILRGFFQRVVFLLG